MQATCPLVGSVRSICLAHTGIIQENRVVTNVYRDLGPTKEGTRTSVSSSKSQGQAYADMTSVLHMHKLLSRHGHSVKWKPVPYPRMGSLDSAYRR